MPLHPLELSAADVRNVCDPDSLGFETTASIGPSIGTVGQDRAIDAVMFGLEIGARGYNLFVAGASGSGRATTVLAKVHETAARMPVARDWVYVHNFADSYRPLAISLPAGMGRYLARDLDLLVQHCKVEIPKVFEAEHYQRQRAEIMRALEAQRQTHYQTLEAEANEVGLTVQFGPSGIITIPLLEGRPMKPEEFEQLSQEDRQRFQQAGEGLQAPMMAFVKQVRDLEQATLEQLKALDRESVLFAVGHMVEGLTEQYEAHPKVVAHLHAIEADIVENHQTFRPQPSPDDQQASQQPRPAVSAAAPRFEDPYSRYRANVLVSRDPNGGAPVVYEVNPTYYNLFGRVDYQAAFGTLNTDFRLIKPGALHQANGGFLVLQARDVLLNPFAWEGLKRSLSCEEVVIENIGEINSVLPTLTVRPEPVPLQVKVILIGNREIFNALYQADEAFRKLFKVKADFDTDTERDPETVQVYAAFVRARIEREGLPQFHKSAVAKIVEHGSRLREHQDKLSTRFGDLADVVTEAAFWARKTGSTVVMAEHVDRAIAQKEHRSSLPRDKTQEVIREGTIQIATQGTAVGQINGLSVLDTGDSTFGIPSRITARVALGTSGISNIERAIEMSGRIHSKGVLILSAFLAARYAQNKPLNISASLTFEQLYNDVDGDSASSTELYALLSALSGLPLRQDIAVTGSVNQYGEVQAVGGVQFKIEGFFDLCAARGLTGAQGVMMPRTNVRHIMLREDVQQAVAEGRFHIYAVGSIDEGVELLTGVPAGQPDTDGHYPEGSVNALVDKRLEEYALRLREFGRPSENGRAPGSALPAPLNAEAGGR